MDTFRVCKATLLKSMKKGNTPIRCSAKAKNGTDYCGRHRKFIVNTPPPPPPPISDGIDCVICLQAIAPKDSIQTPCNHVFHNECLTKWKQRSTTCPCCRAHIRPCGFSNFDLLMRELAIRLDLQTMYILRDSAIVGSDDYNRYDTMIEIRRREDLMNAIY